MVTTDTIQLKLTHPYKELLGNKISSTMSIQSFLKKLGISDIVKAKQLEQQFYSKEDDTYGPFEGADEAISFLKRYE